MRNRQSSLKAHQNTSCKKLDEIQISMYHAFPHHVYSAVALQTSKSEVCHEGAFVWDVARCGCPSRSNFAPRGRSTGRPPPPPPVEPCEDSGGIYSGPRYSQSYCTNLCGFPNAGLRTRIWAESYWCMDGSVDIRQMSRCDCVP